MRQVEASRASRPNSAERPPGCTVPRGSRRRAPTPRRQRWGGGATLPARGAATDRGHPAAKRAPAHAVDDSAKRRAAAAHHGRHRRPAGCGCIGRLHAPFRRRRRHLRPSPALPGSRAPTVLRCQRSPPACPAACWHSVEEMPHADGAPGQAGRPSRHAVREVAAVRVTRRRLAELGQRDQVNRENRHSAVAPSVLKNRQRSVGPPEWMESERRSTAVVRGSGAL